MSVEFKQDAGQSLVNLEGVIDIASAAELKTVLLEVLQEGSEVRVALHEDTVLDVTAVQLLWAAGLAAKASGLSFAFAGPVPKPVSIALNSAGFHGFPVPVEVG